MVDALDALREAHGRIPGLVEGAVANLTTEQLAERPDLGAGAANSIGWLAWHLTRQEDVQISHLAGTEQVWTTDGWQQRFGLPYPPDAMGYGMSAADVGRFAGVTAEQLLGYQRATHAATLRYLNDLNAAALDDVVDHNWDPPVTRMVRLVSVIDDAVQHAGQAAYVRGLLRG